MEDVQKANYDNTPQVMPMEYSLPEDVSTCPLRACLHGGGRPQLGEVTRLSILSLILIDHVYMISTMTQCMLPHLPGVPHLHVKRAEDSGWDATLARDTRENNKRAICPQLPFPKRFSCYFTRSAATLTFLEPIIA